MNQDNLIEIRDLSVEFVTGEHHHRVVNNVSFVLKAGSGLGIIGPSGSGKSSLARMLVGVWEPIRGKIRLDGATYDQWAPEALGQHIGYLQQHGAP
mgnify:CR=1 FL=1